MLPKGQPSTDRLVAKKALGENVVPLHLVMVRVNVVCPVEFLTLTHIGNVQVPVGGHNKFSVF